MNDEELLRYSRHLLLPQVGVEGQEKLGRSSVLIVGVGGLGAIAAMYLGAAGVGHLILCDFDVVELSNLQRQLIHNTTTIGMSKVESAQATLFALNPLTKITTINHRLEDTTLADLVQQVDVVLDCSDNLTTRLAVNQACVKAHIPLVSGAAIRMEGQLIVFTNNSSNSPCYRCLYTTQSIEDTCTRNGVLAPVVGIIGSMQALETLKLLLKINVSEGKLWLLDALSMEWCCIKLAKNKHCPVCSH